MWLVVLVGCRKGDEKFRKLLKANFADFTIVASPAEVNVIRSGKCIVPKFYSYQGGLRRSWGHLVRDGRRILMEKNGRWLTSLLTVLARGDRHTHAKKGISFNLVSTLCNWHTCRRQVLRLTQKLSRASGLGKLTTHVLGILKPLHLHSEIRMSTIAWQVLYSAHSAYKHCMGGRSWNSFLCNNISKLWWSSLKRAWCQGDAWSRSHATCQEENSQVNGSFSSEWQQISLWQWR